MIENTYGSQFYCNTFISNSIDRASENSYFK